MNFRTGKATQTLLYFDPEGEKNVEVAGIKFRMQDDQRITAEVLELTVEEEERKPGEWRIVWFKSSKKGEVWIRDLGHYYYVLQDPENVMVVRFPDGDELVIKPRERGTYTVLNYIPEDLILKAIEDGQKKKFE